MKNILFLLIILSIQISSQVNQNSFYELKNDVINQIQNSDTETNPVFNDEVKKKKSTGLAIIYSFLLPGMGELYAGSYDTGVYFTIAEGALWGTYIGMNMYGNWQKDRYISFAQANAGITTDAKDEDYYATIGEYLNIEQYNNDKAFERNFSQMYNTEKFFWKWNSSEDRKAYRSMWVSSEQTFNDLRFVVGAMLVNRIISAINAVRMVSKYNKSLEQEISWNVYLDLQKLPDNSPVYNLNFSASF
ncbi:MAG: hypothetical protein PHY57_00095 [Ignavibacterium sp.]|jgi:hypothetical protein|nr:hypothetical protein [Ignavibacterium sp.]MDX9713044.1 hypothetical protein [Ignavibacteriaceae bacterium]MEB2353556.1 hypothetical protein [Ignavibacteriales bacterium]